MDPSQPEEQALVPSSPGIPAVPEPDVRTQRWRLFRDLAVFQGKLLLDGIKDLVLGPISLVAAAVGLLMHKDDPQQPFRAVLRWGHGFDRWVDLFGERQQDALPPAPGDPSTSASSDASPSDPPPSREGLDAYVARMEKALVEQYQRGGLTAKAKDAIDKAIDALNQPSDPSGGPPRT